MAQSRDYGGTVNSAIDRSIPPIIGSSDTVIRRMEESRDVGNIGRVDLIFSSGQLPHELALKSLMLFAREALPALQTQNINALKYGRGSTEPFPSKGNRD